MTDHTPGPWICSEARTSIGRAFRIGAGEMIESGKGCCIIYDDYPAGERSRQREANAKLIAAAPDLYDALEAIMDDHDGHIGGLLIDGDHIKWAREALAKARGEPR